MPSSPRPTRTSLLRACLTCLPLLVVLACAARAPEEASGALSGGLYQLRGGVPVALAGAQDIRPVRRLPWTVQERVAALAAVGDRVYAGVNGRGVAELGLGAGAGPEIRYLYEAPLFAHRTLTTLLPEDDTLLVHLYFNAALNVADPADLPQRGVSLLRLAPETGEYRLLTPPFQRLHPEWEAVGFAARSPVQLAFEWKHSGAERTRFAYTLLSLRPTGNREEESDAAEYRRSWGFRELELEAPPALKRVFLEARRRLDEREASTAYHLSLRRGGAALPERYEYHPAGFATADNMRLFTLSAVEQGGRFALLLPDGALLRAADAPPGSGESTALRELRLPALPPGHAYGELVAAAGHVVAAWEQASFTEVGAAGIFLKKVPDFP